MQCARLRQAGAFGIQKAVGEINEKPQKMVSVDSIYHSQP